jgi:hypothetical protein
VVVVRALAALRPGNDHLMGLTRDNVRGLLIVVGIAIVATVFFDVSARIANAIFGVLGIVFICVLWYFGYSWYRSHRTAISLMPDRQRTVMYAGMGATTIGAAAWSLSMLGLVRWGPLGPVLLIVFLAGIFGMFWAWQEAKRYYL